MLSDILEEVIHTDMEDNVEWTISTTSGCLDSVCFVLELLDDIMTNLPGIYKTLLKEETNRS